MSDIAPTRPTSPPPQALRHRKGRAYLALLLGRAAAFAMFMLRANAKRKRRSRGAGLHRRRSTLRKALYGWRFRIAMGAKLEESLTGVFRKVCAIIRNGNPLNLFQLRGVLQCVRCSVAALLIWLPLQTTPDAGCDTPHLFRGLAALCPDAAQQAVAGGPGALPVDEYKAQGCIQHPQVRRSPPTQESEVPLPHGMHASPYS